MMHKTLQILNHKTVHYTIAGTGHPLVLVHGVGMRAKAWQPQIDFFAKNYQVIAVNVAGHNGSDCLAEGASLADFVTWFNAFFDALGIKQAIVIGHSMGGLITQGFAISYPKKVKAIGLLNMVYKRDSNAKKAVIARSQFLSKNESMVDMTLERWFDNIPSQAPIKQQVKQYLLSMDKTGYAITYKAFAHGDDAYVDTWETVKCPVLLLTGEKDLNSTPDMSKTLARMIPNGAVKIIPQQKHMVHLTHPDVVNTCITDWLQQHI